MNRFMGSITMSLTLLLLALLAQQGMSFSFNFRNFGPNTKGLFLEQDAFLSIAGIDLTLNQVDRNIGFSYGRASYEDPIQLWDPATRELANFTTRFTFSIRELDNRTNTGDGMTFFLAPAGSLIANNSAGENLGLISWPDPVTKKIDNRSVVAVEFDTFKNWFDPSPEHIGIDIGSVISVVNVTWNNGSLKDGRVATSWLSYDSASHNFSVFLTFDENPVLSQKYCILWHQLDLRLYLPERIRVGFTASTGAYVETHTILSWSFNSSMDLIKNNTGTESPPSPSLELTPPTGDTTSASAIGLGVGFGGATVCGIGIFLWFICVKKRKGSDRESDIEEAEDEFDPAIDGEFEGGAGPKRFTYSELKIATMDFSEEGKLGEGGFGGVYKGSFATGQVVAVKRISKASKQGSKEYISEVKIISRLGHRNLVKLIGWCHKKGEFLLVYEYLPNGSLDSHLFPGGKFPSPLPWGTRHRIAMGLASSVLYLHEEWEQCVVHRDIKSSNIMLDSNFNAKLGDFGLARLVDHEYSLHTVAFAGTMGYIAPECMETGRSSKESDVYSFGVVALEICCGRRSVVPNPSEPTRVRLVNWVWELYGKGQLLEAVDERLGTEFEAREIECLMIVGLWCCHPDPSFRPPMKQVMGVLKFESPLPDNLPRELPRPMYYASSFNVSLNSYTSSSAFTGSSVASSSSATKSDSKPLLKA